MADTATGTEVGEEVTVTDPLIGKQTSTESALSNYVGPYVTDMLGRGQALANEGYQAYLGPLTAGASDLQQQAFDAASGLASLAMPTENISYTPQSFTDEGVAAQYMNPYLTAALQPQIDEARRQAEIQRVQDAGRLTRAGAFGGSRQAIMESEGARNLASNLAGITGQGYRDAFNRAQQQFNTEQNRLQTASGQQLNQGLAALSALSNLGGIQRGIESEGIKADRGQFEEERDFPYKQVQYMQSLLQGLPLAAQNYSYQQPSLLSEISGTAGGLMDLYDQLGGSEFVNDLFGKGYDFVTGLFSDDEPQEDTFDINKLIT
tara:strand:- start:3112 stop:4071 length:960 start_codon:yes stop_codon:yes gene_type:complete